MAVDRNGEALSYNGSSWSTSLLAAGGQLNEVSCVTSVSCLAEGGSLAGAVSLQYDPNAALTACSALTISTLHIPSGTLHKAYSGSVAGCSGKMPYKFRKTGRLPKGLKLAKNGVISGTPSKAGSYVFQVKLTDKSRPHRKTVLKTYGIVVN
jgi:hypothetical protein